VDWCCMRRCSSKTVDHLFVHCDVAKELWSLVFSMFSVHWLMPKTILELLFGWSNWFGKHGSYLVWNMVPLCLKWKIWRERNSHTFNGVEVSIIELTFSFMRSLFEWSHIMGG
jgi:hypothetical protein